jgi:hypothetical protein
MTYWTAWEKIVGIHSPAKGKGNAVAISFRPVSLPVVAAFSATAISL